MEILKLDYEDWVKRGKELFGEDFRQWRFMCPICSNVATPQQFRDAGADPQMVTQNCIGRHVKERHDSPGPNPPTKEKPCDYAAYGLLRLAPMRVTRDGEEVHCFAFDEGEGDGNTDSKPDDSDSDKRASGDDGSS